MKQERHILGKLCRVLACCLAGAVIVGCGEDLTQEVRSTSGSSHPLIRKAEQRSRSRDIDGAIALYQKALMEEPRLSHAHLQLAVLFDERKQNYLRSIHHYQRFLELEPETEKKELIEQSIRHCRISFAATMKEAQGDQLDEVRDLRAEIANLKEQNAKLGETIARYQNTETSARAASPRSADPSTGEPRGESASPSAGTAAPPVRLETVPEEPAVVVRTYKVQSGDTLSTISRKMYGKSSLWDKIYQANRDRMRSQNDLKIGQELRIP